MPLWSSALLALLSLVVLLIAIAAHLQARRRGARLLYQRRLEAALSDGTLTPDEIAELEGLQLAKDLSQAEVRMVARAIYRGALRDVLADARLVPEEDHALRALQAQLGLTDDELGHDHLQLSRLRLMAQIEAGAVPEIEAPIALVPHERCHWVVQATFAERIGVARSADNLKGIRLSVTSGEPFRFDGKRAELRPNEAILPVDLGILVVTSRRTVFQGAKRTVSIPHARLETVVLFADGLSAEEIGGNSRGYLLVDDADLTAAVLQQAARKRRSEIRPLRPEKSA
jgi:hypothetical protein